MHRWTAHFLFAQGLSKAVNLIFWVSTYMELNVRNHRAKKYMGYWALAVQGFQILLMGDFLLQ